MRSISSGKINSYTDYTQTSGMK